MSKLNNAVVANDTKKGIVYHTNPKKTIRYQKFEKDLITIENKRSKREEVKKIYLNLIQRQMYRRLMYGMKEYDKLQIKSMSENSIKQIEYDYKQAKRAIHILKAKKCFMAETKLVNAMFKRTDIGNFWFRLYRLCKCVGIC